MTIYEKEKDETLLTPDGAHFTLSERFTQEEFSAIRSQIQEGKRPTPIPTIPIMWSLPGRPTPGR
ncbi:MAG: hypothetical protein ACLUNQ_09385 [Oscillospiraceae bacterium]